MWCKYYVFNMHICFCDSECHRNRTITKKTQTLGNCCGKNWCRKGSMALVSSQPLYHKVCQIWKKKLKSYGLGSCLNRCQTPYYLSWTEAKIPPTIPYFFSCLLLRSLRNRSRNPPFITSVGTEAKSSPSFTSLVYTAVQKPLRIVKNNRYRFSSLH